MNVRIILAIISSLSLVSSFAQDCLTSPTGLVGWWTGDNHALDLAALPDHGTPQSLSYGPGRVHGAFRFQGASSGGIPGGYGGYATGSSIAIQPSPELNVKSLTFAAWINPGTEDYRPIMMYQRDGDYAGALFWTGYLAGHTSQGSLYANLREAPGREAVVHAPGVIVTNRWTFVAVTYDRTNGVARLFVNDRLLRKKTSDRSARTPVVHSTSGTVPQRLSICSVDDLSKADSTRSRCSTVP